MAKSVRYKDGTRIQENVNSEAWNLSQSKDPKDAERLKKHMQKLDEKWRSAEGRKQVAELTEREKMLEGRIPWDPVRLKELEVADAN